MRQLVASQQLTIEQMNLFNEAEAAADPSVPEPTLEEAVSGYSRQPQKAKATQEEIPARLPIIEGCADSRNHCTGFPDAPH